MSICIANRVLGYIKALNQQAIFGSNRLGIATRLRTLSPTV